MRKAHQKEGCTLTWFSGPLWFVQNVNFHWNKPHLWNGISEGASDGSFSFDFGNQFWNWHIVSWKWWHFFAVGCSLRFPASLSVGSNTLQLQILITGFCSAMLVDERHWEPCWVEVDTWPSQSMTCESYCKSKTLYWFCRMDWKLTIISQNPLTCSSSVYSQGSICITQLSSKIISFYFPLHSIVILPYLWKVDKWMSLFSTKASVLF